MRSLPSKARWFVVFIWTCALLSVLGVRLYTGPKMEAGLFDFIVFLLLGAVAGRIKVDLSRGKGDSNDMGSLSLESALVFAALLRFGPGPAMLVGATSTCIGCLFPSRQPLYQLLFNVALSVTEIFISGLIFVTLNGGTLRLNLESSFPAIVATSLSFFVINTSAVAMIIALCTEQRIFPTWKESFLWTAPSYFAGASVSTVSLLIFRQHVGAVLLFGSPIAYLTYCSYSVYTARAHEKQKHIEELQTSQEQLASLYLATIKSLALAIDAKDQYTHQHILRVQKYAVATAKQMGLSGDELEGINTGALLHDIGKLGVPEYVLLKPGKLTSEEFEKIKKHPEIGAAILDPVDFPWPVLPAVKYHHEKWDGSGYPEGLAGENIPLPGRILAVADAYDALTTSRSYRHAWSHERALNEIKRTSGTHFDPVVVVAFLEVIDDIVQQMLLEGDGPLAISSLESKGTITKSDEAAREIQRASSELWALYEVVQTLSSSLGLQETLDILARKLEAIVPGTACLFLLKEESDGMLAARAAVGINQPFFESCRTAGNTSLSLQVADSRETYLGVYDMDDLLLCSSPITQWIAINCALIVPIVHQGTILGTINLYHPQQYAFGSHDKQLLEMIAERAAMAIYNGILYDRTRSRASTDPLTGLYNIRYLTEYVDERCQRTESRQNLSPEDVDKDHCDQFALLCLDLDSFKPINDLFGHQKGDEVLRALAKIFQRIARKRDVVARYGGDEFLIVLEGATAEVAEDIAERIQKTVAAYNPGLSHPKLGGLRLGVSIGSACFPQEGSDCATLLSVADSKMYRNKGERKLEQMAERAHFRNLSTEASIPHYVRESDTSVI
jgi:diguanylate cyclase (GGDEF)-like protein/putative nucleotidyltransferase with HDIG domain